MKEYLREIIRNEENPLTRRNLNFRRLLQQG